MRVLPIVVLLAILSSQDIRGGAAADPGAHALEVGCVPGKLAFTKTSLTVKAGEPIALTLTNPDAVPHNLVIVGRGTPLAEIGKAADELARTPEGILHNYVPEDPRILHATRLVDPGEREVLRFVAPLEPGIYPYVCTFPGHWLLMRGKLIVE